MTGVRRWRRSCSQRPDKRERIDIALFKVDGLSTRNLGERLARRARDWTLALNQTVTKIAFFGHLARETCRLRIVRRVVHLSTGSTVAEVDGSVFMRRSREATVIHVDGASAQMSRLHHRHCGRLGILVLMLAAGEVVLQRVHVWWKLGDLSEKNSQVKADYKSYQVQTSNDGWYDESCEKKRVGACELLVEDVSPSVLVVGRSSPILVSEPSCVDVEGNETTIHDHAKDVVASARGWSASLCRTSQVVDAIGSNAHIPCRLRIY